MIGFISYNVGINSYFLNMYAYILLYSLYGSILYLIMYELFNNNIKDSLYSNVN